MRTSAFPKWLAAAFAGVALAACSSLPAADGDVARSPWAEQSGFHGSADAKAWAHQGFPGKVATRFDYARTDGRDTVAVRSQSAASMLRQVVRIEPRDLGRVRFSWKVPALIEQADLASRENDDAPVRVVLAFEGDRSRFSAKDAALSELAHALTGEPMPYATLMYVWCNQRPAGTVIRGARTDRIRKLVVESGAAGLDRWLEYERDIRADYERVFGEKPGALVGVAIMTDTDNTRSQTRAWYGPVRFLPVAAR